MLIDEYLPAFDAIERHSTLVRASPEQVYLALRTTDLAQSLLVRGLLAVRVLPEILRHGGKGRLGPKTIQLRAFEVRGFAVLAENPPHELLIGLVGSFWTLSGGLRPVNAATFVGPQLAGTARAAWNFSIAPGVNGDCELSTETRVQCADPSSRRRFRAYWMLIRPGSGLIRRLMLKAIRHEAEWR